MKFNQFVDELSQRGVKLWAEGNQLRVRAPKGVLTPELRDLLTEYKAELLGELQRSNAIAIKTDLLLAPVSREGDLPLSFGQERLWFLNQIDPTNPSYNEFAALCLNGSLNVEALERSINEIIRRHEVLRTTFREVNGQPIQVVASTLKIAMPLIDLRQFPNDERETEIQRLTTELVHRPFDLTAGPLLRVLLLQLEKAEHIFIINVHHIVFDGWSGGIFFRELAALYEAFCSNKPSPLPELPLQYADFAHWQRRWLQGLTRSSYLAYWKEKLQGAPPILELPTDRPRTPVQTFRGAHQSMLLSKDLSEAVANLSKQENVSLFMTLLTAFQILLYRYTGQADICIGTPIANRTRLEIEGLIGFFVNTLVLRTDLSGNPSFLTLLLQVREVALGAYAYQELPFEQLVEELRPARSLSHTPLFSVMFVFHNVPLIPSEFPGLTVSPFEVENFTAKLDLTLSFENEREGLIGVWEYNTDLFDAATIARMAGHFKTLLEGIVAKPDQRLSELPLLTAAERHQLLVEWNDTEADYPKHLCLHQLFEAQVERTPDAVAVVFEEQQLTYRELNAKANQLAHHLQKLGVKPEVLVGICIERSLEMVVGLLGILKAGGAYVPLDPAYPKKRLAYMLADSQVSVLLTQENLLDEMPENKGRVVCLAPDWNTLSQEPDENSVSCVKPENLAYVIYTSGSTGMPKGVMVQHSSIVNLLTGLEKAISFPRPDSALRVSLNASLAFDASVQQLIHLLRGRTLDIVPQALRFDGRALLSYLQQHQIDVLDTTPSQLKLLISTGLLDTHTFPSCVLVGGEAIDAFTWTTLTQAEQTNFYNVYGPTECTVDATVAHLKMAGSKSTIGRPLANTQVYILDSQLQPIPIGVQGELYIGGAGVARGYFNRPELTEEKFIPNPFSDEPGARLYKTGDIARYLPDGNIEYLGRTDNQVKVRGFRIELGEIESLLAQHPDVGTAVVIAREDTPGEKRLVAYVVPAQEPAPTRSDLRRFLQEQVPEYMVPAAFVILEALPVTANGKVDRRSLPAPDTCNLGLESSFVSPRSHLEMQLVQIWENVLNVHPVGVRDCFFERGGHSLLAVRLMALIQQQFGKSLPLASLFQNSTIEHQASLLLQQTDSQPSSPLVAIHTAGSQPSFFCVHPVGGNVLCYFELARHLGKEQPFYGLQSVGLNGEQEPLVRIEDMAAHYIEALQAIQPSGPYYLGGWSLGGVVAFEMAQQLRDRGEEVALLALIDSYAPTAIDWHEDNNDEASLLVHLARDMGGMFGKELPISADELRELPPLEQLNYILERSKNLNILPPEVSVEQMRHLMRVFQANREAMLSYIPQPYPGKMALLSAIEKPLQVKLDPSQGWDKLATHGLLDIQPISGDHYAILRAPHVQLLAQQLATYLKTENQ